MRKAQRTMSVDEKIRHFDHILDTIVENSKHEVRPVFERRDRRSQDGYDILKYLVEEDVIQLGDDQYKINDNKVQ